MFSPENMSSESPNELGSDGLRDTRQLPVDKFHVSNLDSSADDSMDQAEPWWVCHSAVCVVCS